MFYRIAAAIFIIQRLMAQASCASPAPTVPPNGVTIFTPQQEGYLGDVVAETMQAQLKVYPQPALIAPLERLAERLTRNIAGNPYRFRFSLIEIPQANAFVLPGGRVYVSRRLIAAVASEDELAGVIAHEMGHVVARQASVAMTKTFKSALNVTSVGDRQDIIDKFHQLMDNAGRRPGAVKRDLEDDQLVADRVSLEVVWRAGYDPQGLPRFLDRLTDNKGASGGFFSDLFGLTLPETKRIRELIKAVEALPVSCRETHADGASEFRAWQETVAALGREDMTLAPSALVPKLQLAVKLRPAVTNIRFSPNGAMLLVQDESGINVLRREPLETLFRIPALDAKRAVFGKDSTTILFEAAGVRLEVWDVQKRARQVLWEPPLNQSCRELLPSPDGRVVACLVNNNEYRLIEIAGSNELARHRFTLDPLGVLISLLERRPARPMEGAFTPDGGAFLMGSAMIATGSDSWAYDVGERTEMKVGKPLSNLIGAGFGFVGADRIAVMNERDQRNSGVFSWPEGKQISKFVIPDFPFTPATKGSVVFLRPFRDYAVAALDLNTQTLFQASRTPAMDRYDDVAASERVTGEIGLYPGRQTTPSATLQLPEADLGRLRGGAHSPDLQWLAVSVSDRSMLWNLTTGKASLYRPFDGGSMSKDGVWTTTFERFERKPNAQTDSRVSVRTAIALQNQSTLAEAPLPEKDQDRSVSFVDRYEVALDRNLPKKGRHTLSVRDTVSTKILWTREFEEDLRWYTGNALVFQFAAKSKEAERIFKSAPELKAKLDAAPKRDDIAVLDVLSLETGESQGRALFDDGGGSVSPRRVLVAGQTLFVEDSNFRTLAYSLKTGERAGQQFGRVLAVETGRGLAALENQSGSVTVYDAAMKQMAAFTFPGNVVYAGFDGEGKRLLALTGAHQVFIENLP